MVFDFFEFSVPLPTGKSCHSYPVMHVPAVVHIHPVSLSRPLLHPGVFAGWRLICQWGETKVSVGKWHVACQMLQPQPVPPLEIELFQRQAQHSLCTSSFTSKSTLTRSSLGQHCLQVEHRPVDT